MKAILISTMIILSWYSYSMQDTIIDTTIKHSVKQVDEHLVIQDTILIEKTIPVEKTKEVSKRSYWVEIIVLCLVATSFINHYRKRNKNG